MKSRNFWGRWAVQSPCIWERKITEEGGTCLREKHNRKQVKLSKQAKKWSVHPKTTKSSFSLVLILVSSAAVAARWSGSSLRHARRQVQKPRQEWESLSFIYKAAHLHNPGTSTATPRALHGERAANLLCLPQPQSNSSSSKRTTSRVSLTSADTHHPPGRAHTLPVRHTTSRYNHPGTERVSHRTGGAAATQRGKRATQDRDGACGLCQPSVPEGIKQACQTELEGAN